jgi:hypothetical protein
MLRAVMRRKRLWRKKELRVMMMRSRMTLMNSPLSLLAAMGRGLLKKRLATSLIPRRAIKPPTSNKAKQLLVHLPSTSKE